MTTDYGRYTGNGGLRVSRRGLLLAGAAAGGALAARGLLRPTGAWAASTPFVSYHGLDSAGHQQKIAELTAQGYRMTSLSVYGSPAQYAAVWVQRSGPAWVAVQDLTTAGYQAKFDEFTSQGYVPTIVTATGPSTAAVFAAVFEKTTPASWFARHNIDHDTFATANESAKENALILASLAVYGSDADDRRYAGVWLPNPGGVKWNADATGDSAAYQGWFDGYVNAGLRPVIVDANDGGQYAALFTDGVVGDWVGRHDMTATDYQNEFNTQVSVGRMPISVQGSGTGSGIRYAAVFVSQDPPVARQWTRIDSAGAAYTGVHDVVRTFMQRYGIRAGQLAIRKNGSTKLASGYTWSEPNTGIIQPGSPMRLASVSKAFTCAAIWSLVQDQRLTLSTKVFPYLGITTVALPGQSKDSRVDDITVQQLVDHTGGWESGVSGLDPVFAGRAIARALGLPGRVTKRDVARYMYGEPLQYTPGDSTLDLSLRYSNFGYLLLGLVVEQCTGQSFIDYLKNRVLGPLGLSGSVLVGTTLRSDKLPNEVTYEAPAVGLSAWDPWSDAKVPAAYGTFLIAEMDSGGGLVSNAPALVTFIGSNAVWGMGGRTPGYARTGSMPGTSSRIVSRADGIDWAYIFNTREIPAELVANGNLDGFAADIEEAISASGI